MSPAAEVHYDRCCIFVFSAIRVDFRSADLYTCPYQAAPIFVE
ncbi:MAG: hypothetical protein KatS3mg105_1791 [Gemmatales bacterium]|nr:MAG: hypothetical protein KatS3mg105_1791 [Gemmatales bacterium]